VSTAAYLPTLSASGSVSNNHSQTGNQAPVSSLSQTASLSASYLLYDFGGRSATLENAKQLLIAANASRDATLQGSFLSAVQAYYALLSAGASVLISVSDEGAGKSGGSSGRYQAGVATPVDRLQAQTCRKRSSIASGEEASNAQGTLANLMGFDASAYILQAVEESTPDPVSSRISAS
jgi:outer membrane protein TolC